MAITDSLDAATQQVLALLAQLKLSNARVVQAQDTGAADNITLTPVPAISAYGPDLVVVADVANANVTTTPKINVSGLGQVTIAQSNGGAVGVGAVFGKCIFGFSSVSGGGYQARLIGAASAGASGAALTYTGDDTSGTANAVTATMTPSMGAYIKGATCRVKIANTVTGATTANLGPGAKVVTRANGAALQAGDMLAGQEATLVYDGTNLQVEGLNPTNVVQRPTSAGAVTITYGIAADQNVSSNVQTTVALAGSASPFCSIASSTITIAAGMSGIYFLAATVNADTFQPSGELQYSSLIIFKNGGLLTQTTISNYSYGEVLVALNLAAAAFLAAGDTLTMGFYTHSQNNDDHGDIIRSGSTLFTLVKVV